jgi:hypothetical protein
LRIDEFSSVANIDGSISSTEQTRFLLFGFDITLSTAELADGLVSLTMTAARASASITSKLPVVDWTSKQPGIDYS